MQTAKRICPQCGTPLAPNESFCSNCGRRYIDAPIAEPTAQSTSSTIYPWSATVYSGASHPNSPPLQSMPNAAPPSSYGNPAYGYPPPGAAGQSYTPPPPYPPATDRG